MTKVDGYQSLPGWFDFHDLYQRAVDEHCSGAPGVFIEIGTCFGKSACFMGERIVASGKQISFFTVDTFDFDTVEASIREVALSQIAQGNGNTFEGVARHFIEACGLKDVVHLLVESSVEAASRHQEKSVDFVFIDGAHDYDSVRADISAWWPRLRQNRWMGGHDFGMESVRLAVQDAFAGHHVMQEGGCWTVFKHA